uniref:Poly(A) RNA polymerase mitochondrial-like central palm domain-containing protein n=1 Tax=Opuntia streptacantha TaxID=393608 RepID=A0A7C9EX02_OPUST
MEADLLMIAKKHVLQGFQKNADLLSGISALEVQLNDVFGSCLPNMRDYDNRRDLIHIFNEIAREIYGKNNECPVVEGFGSFLMDMFNAKSDLDLSINFSDKKVEARRDAKIKALRKFANKFYVLQKKKHVTNVQPILSAKVPVLKVTDCGTGIECDLSVGNMDGIAKSHIILMVSSIDERFKKLCFLMKAWAKAYDINSSKDGTLNSLSLVLLVAFHLQSREQPILPPFSALFKDGTDPEAVKKNIPRFLNYGNGNKESVADLFVSLLLMLESAEMLWPMGLCVSTYEGSWIYKIWESKKGDKIGLISIEDFTERSQNTARAVKLKNITKIYSSIRCSLLQIRSFTSGKIDADKLKNRLFGPDSLTENVSIKTIAHPVPWQPNLQDTTQRKRKRSKQKKEKKWVQKQDGSSVDGSQAQAPAHPSAPEKKVTKGLKKLGRSSIVQTWAQAPLPPNQPVQPTFGFRRERNHAEITKHPTPDLHHSVVSTSCSAMPYHPTRVASASGSEMPYNSALVACTSGGAMPYHSTPMASTSGNAMCYHPTHYLPTPPYAHHVELERSYNSNDSLPFVPFHAPNTRSFRAFGSNMRYVEANHRHNTSGAHGEYPLFFSRPP